MADGLLDVVADVAKRLWPTRPASIEALPGGITNANFKVDLGGEQVVVRVPGANTNLLGIDRETEVAVARIAAGIGVAPEIIAVDATSGCIVSRFIEGRPIPMAELRTEPVLRAVVTTIARVHQAGSVAQVFDHFAVIRAYHLLARDRGVTEPFDYDELAGVLARIERARPFRARVLGHNDLLNGNFLDDGSVRIFDWEYAGMADPYFDLANLSVNNELGSENDELLLSSYFGSSDSSKLASLALMKLVSEIREAMWGVVQMAISELEVDFVAYARERGERVAEMSDEMDVVSLLKLATED